MFIFIGGLMITSLFFSSCTKDEVSKINNEFSIKSIDGEEVKSLSIELLTAIHKDLIQKNRSDDAKTLYELYDRNTGFLKSANLNELAIPRLCASIGTDSAKMVYNKDTVPMHILKSWEQQNVYLYAHIERYGDSGPYEQAPNDYDYTYFPYFAGTTGQTLRLEGMWLQTAQFLLQTRPTIFYTLCNTDGTWTSTATWGQYTGTRNQSKAVVGLKIWTTTPNCNIWYIAHSHGVGWTTGWHNDGQFAGYNGRRLEAYAMQILRY